jgi:hypothetical protein
MNNESLFEAARLAALDQLTPAKLAELVIIKGAKIHFIAPLESSSAFISVRWRIDTDQKGPILDVPRKYIDWEIARNLVPRLYVFRKCDRPLFNAVMSYCRSQEPRVVAQWECAIARLWGL